MSKLIIEMEMPKDCPMCPMAHYNKLEEFTGCEVAPGKRYAVKTDKAYAESACRPDWCPIKGVLPEQHGRLVDADVAYDKIAEQEGGYYMDMDGVGRGLDETPAIVPATERSET